VCAVNRSGSQHTPLYSARSLSCSHNRVRWVYCTPRLFCYPKALPLYNIQTPFCASHIHVTFITSETHVTRISRNSFQGAATI
ncbi:unnamed protein product, partial [Ectocarpus sp. 13 AM-2016]